MAKKELESEFNSFFNFFTSAANIIEQIYPKNPTFCDGAITLLCSYIDALSVFRYGGGRKGFVQFIENYSDNQLKQYYTKVSALFLDKPPLSCEGKVMNGLIKSKIKQIRKRLYDNNAVYDSLNEIDKDSAIKKLRRFKDISKYIEIFTYSNYFYIHYRCFGVHNAQLPGYNNCRDIHPFYIATTDLNTGQLLKWDLVFSFDCILNTLKSCIDNFKQEIDNKIRSGKNLSKNINKYKFVIKEYSIKNQFFTNFLKYRKI